MEEQLDMDRERGILESQGARENIARLTGSWYKACPDGARIHTVRADRSGGYCKPPKKEYGVMSCPLSRHKDDYEMFCLHDDLAERCCCQKDDTITEGTWLGLQTQKFATNMCASGFPEDIPPRTTTGSQGGPRAIDVWSDPSLPGAKESGWSSSDKRSARSYMKS